MSALLTSSGVAGVPTAERPPREHPAEPTGIVHIGLRSGPGASGRRAAPAAMAAPSDDSRQVFGRSPRPRAVVDALRPHDYRTCSGVLGAAS